MFGFEHHRKPDVAYRISAHEEENARFIALCLDGGGLVLTCTGIGAVVTEGLGIAGNAGYLFWFYKKGARFTGSGSASKAQVLFFNSVVEVIPFLNGFYPGFTIEVNRLIEIMCKEDEEKAAKKRAEEEAQQLRYLREVRQAQIREEQLARQYDEAA